MHLHTALFSFLLATTTATPTTNLNLRQYQQLPPSPFFLVTTSQSTPTSNSSELANVSATSLFNPFSSDILRLRLQSAPYGSLPNFTLTAQDQLSSTVYSSRNRTFAPFHSIPVSAGEELQFLGPGLEEGAGSIGLENGYLVSVGNETKGWTVCAGDLSERVLVWKGGLSCDEVYLHAVGSRPY